MTADQVQVGQTYAVKVSGKIQPVRITGTSSFGGWDGVNVNTKRAVRIRSARKLRKHMTGVGQGINEWREFCAAHPCTGGVS